MPIAPAKTEGPATKLIFLGIELDTVSLTMSLPQEKLEHLCTMIQDRESKKSCTKRELLSLIGYLQHACRVIKPGRSFLRRMIDLSAGVRALHHRVRLNAGFRSDLKWWHCFLPLWNGTCPMASVVKGAHTSGSRYAHTNQLTVAMEGNSDSIPCRSTLPGGYLRPVNWQPTDQE